MVDRFASQLAAFRADSAYAPYVYLSVYAPEPLIVAEVTALHPEPMTAVVVTIDTGDYLDIRRGMRIVFYTSAGDYKGETRIRYIDAASDTVFLIRETSSGYINIEVGDAVKIFPFVPMDTKIVESNQQFSPDGLLVSTFGSNPPPRVTSGGHSAGWVDGYRSASSSTFRSVPMDGSNTVTTDPDSSSGVDHTWSALVTAGAALQTGSADTDESPVYELDAGVHLIEHIAEDADTSVAGVQYTAHMVHDASYPPYEVMLATPPQGDDVSGWSWEVELFEQADLDAIPDGALCILWADEWINGEYASYRSLTDGRSNILGVGYARRDTSSGDGDEGDRLTMEIQSPLARLNEIASYSKVMEENASPDAWSEVKTLGVERAIVQLWMFYTSGQEAGFDFITHALFSDARYPAFYLQRSDPIGQMRELADGRRARIVNTERGMRIELQPDPALLSISDRSSVTITVTLTDDDVFSYEYPREHFDSIEILELRGITAGTSGNTAVYARAPGLAPAGGSQSAVVERCIPDDQTAANVESGLRWARLDNVFVDTDGKKHRVGELTLRLPGVYGFFDFDLAYVRFQYDGSLRGIDFTDYRFYLKRVSAEVDGDTGEWVTVVTLQAETYAPPGATFVYPADGTGVGDGQPPPWSFPPIIPITPGGVMISGGTGRLAFIDSNNYLYYTLTANSTSPTWYRVALSVTGDACDFVPNAFSPRYISGGDVIELYVATTTRVYMVELDVSDFSVTENEQATLTTTSVSLRRIETERGVEGLVVIASSIIGTATEITTTTDGSTWGSPVSIAATGGAFAAPGLYVAADGTIYTSTNTSSTASSGQRSTNLGVSFSALANPNIDSYGSAYGLHIPYHNNTSKTVAYFGYDSVPAVGSGVRRIYRTNGASQVDISPTFGGSTGGVQLPRAIDTCPINRSRLVACLRNGTTQSTAASDDVRIGYCPDGGASASSWQFITALDGTPGTGAYAGVRCAGDDPNIFWAFGLGGLIAKCNFNGQYQNLYGNLGSFTSPSVGLILNIIGV